MDNRNPFEIKFHNELTKLTENLLEIYKSDNTISKSIKKFYINYKKCISSGNRSDFITSTVDILESKMDDVKIQNEFIFSDDYSTEPLYLLPELDFKQLWKSNLIDVYKKQIIWKSLKNLYLVGCYFVNKQNQHIIDIVNQFKLEHLIKKEIDNDENSSGNLENDIQMLFNELFGKESFIYEIIKLDDIQQIVEEIKVDPMKVIRKYTSNNCQKIKDLSHKLYEKIKEKIMKGELSKDKIDKDMEKINKIMDKFKSELPNDPRFKSIFDNIKNFLNIDLSKVMTGDPANIVNEINSKLKDTCGFTVDDLCNKSETELNNIIENNAELKNNLSDLTKSMENINSTDGMNSDSFQNFIDMLKLKTSTPESKSQNNEDNDLPIIDEKSLPNIENSNLPNLE